MICTRCGNNLTRPSPLSTRTQICKECRRTYKLEEQARMKSLSIKIEEPVYEKDETMNTTQTIIHEPPEKQLGTLAEIHMEKKDKGIYIYFKSPMLQNFMFNTVSESWGVESTTNMSHYDKPDSIQAQYIHGWKESFKNQYKKIATFNPYQPLVDTNGVINLGFFYLVNAENVKDPYSISNLNELIDPKRAIEFYYRGIQTNDQLDEYIVKIKEIVYKIYTDHMAAYNKRLIINFTEEDNAKQTA